MLNKNNWITSNETLSSFTFRKKVLLDKEVKSAYITIACMGWYNLYINDNRVDKTVFSTGWTEYHKRVQCQRYELKNISNVLDIKIDVGEGWAASIDFGRAFKHRGDTPLYFPKSINYEIDIVFIDGSEEKIISDDKDEVYSNIVDSASIYMGETQNALKEIKYLSNAVKTHYDSEIIPQEGEDIVFGETFLPQKMWRDNNNDLIIDFGQNFAGVVEVHFKGNKGDKISFVPGEVLDKDGNFYNANYRAAKSFYSFVLTGNDDVFCPKFSYLGGRYIKLIDYPDNITKEAFVGRMVQSKLDQTCFFSSTNKMIQRLYLNTYYGQLSNYLDIPTDCPQRNERLGWTADAQVFSKTAAIHFNVDRFFHKWMTDMRLSQDPDGGVNSVIPFFEANLKWVASGWSDACFVIPDEIYEAYDDVNILKENLSMIEGWFNYLKNHQIEKNIIELSWSFGDWLALDTKYGVNNFQGATTYSLISTAYYYYLVKTIIKIKSLLNEDYKEYELLKDDIKKSFINKYMKDGHLIGRKMTFECTENEKSNYTQTALAIILCFGLYNDIDKESLGNDLEELIHLSNDRLTTGFLGTPYILEALAIADKIDLAYKLLLSEDYPSWLYSVKLGATTMWEHWDGIKEDGTLGPAQMNSYNHYAYGSVFSFIFERLMGIKKIAPGYKEVIISPNPRKEFGDCSCLFKSVNGDINVSWKYNDDHILYDINIDEKIKTKIVIDGITFNENKLIYKGKLK